MYGTWAGEGGTVGPEFLIFSLIICNIELHNFTNKCLCLLLKSVFIHAWGDILILFRTDGKQEIFDKISVLS